MTIDYERSDELGGMAVNDLWIRRGIANLLDPHGMAGSEIVDAPCVSMSLERKSGTRIGYTDSIGWVRFDSFPDHLQTQTNIIIMKYFLEEALTLTVLTAMCMYGYLILIAVV